jgi:NADH-quinone oxidoreductase subunit C
VYTIDPVRNHLVVSKLNSQFGESKVIHEIMADMLCITVSKEIIADIMLFLRDDDELQFNFLTTLCGMHYHDSQHLGVVYHLHSLPNNHRIRIKTMVPETDPVLPTITTVWPSANWQERETFDFYGIRFEGHPNLVRILNMDDMVGFPLRKDFPLEDQTREDKDDSMFGR